MPKHTHSKRCYFFVAVHALFIRDNKVLLLNRANTGYMDGFYSVPAGHVDGVETIWQAMAREIREEVGIVLDDTLQPDPIHVMHRTKTDDEERIDYFYTITDWTGEVENCEPEKCDHLAWHDLDDLPENMVPYVRKALEYVRDGVMFSEFDESMA